MPRARGGVRVDQHDGCTELVLQHPQRRNALDISMVEAALAAVRGCSSAPETRVLLLRGEDPTFCAGLDLTAMRDGDSDRWIAEFFERWLPLHAALAALQVPVVCALQGAAINAGAALALAADFLVADEEAFLQVGEVQQGLAAPIAIGWLSLRHSPALARHVCLRGNRIHGQELFRRGIAHDCAPAGTTLERARALAAELATLPPEGVRRTLVGLESARAATAVATDDAGRARGCFDVATGAVDPLDYFTRLADAAAVRRPAGFTATRIDRQSPQRKGTPS